MKSIFAALSMAVLSFSPTLVSAADAERWAGGYVGTTLGTWQDDSNSPQFQGALIAGYNFVLGSSGLVAGLEANLGQFMNQGLTYHSQYLSVMVGAPVAGNLYTYVGYGVGEDDGTRSGRLTLGADYALGGHLSLGTQLVRGNFIGGSYSWTEAQLAVKVHF
jgi:hypothetical protein